MADVQQLIQQGVEAARAGNKAQARELFQQATDTDMNNERAWLWLATVTDDPQEKRIHIENVLHINPDNDRAQQMLLQLDSAGGNAKQQANELAPGVSRSRVMLIGGVSLVVWLALLITLIVIGGNRRGNFREMVSATAQVIALAQATQTEQVLAETATSEAVTATAAIFAQETATATAQIALTERADGAELGMLGSNNALPPTWTPTPDDGGPELLVTPTPLESELPRGSLAGQILVGWGGLDRLNRGYTPITAYQLDIDSERQLGEIIVNNVDINPANGQELVYTVYYPETFGFGIEISNLTVTSRRLLSTTWQPLDQISETQQISFSPDGSKLVFIAPVSRDFNVIRQVFLLDLNFTPAPNVSPLRPMTNDFANYSDPAISPDNSRIIAIKEDPQSLDPGPDLVVIEVDGGLQTPLKPDGSQTIEENPEWVLPDGNEIAYAGRVAGEASTFDIIRLNLNNPDAPAQFLSRDPLINENNPVFSPDGRFMAFADDRSGVFNIFVQELATGQVYQITNDNDNDNFPGGWFQPDVVPPRGAVVLPTPIIVQEADPES